MKLLFSARLHLFWCVAVSVLGVSCPIYAQTLPRNFTLPTPLFATNSAWNQTVTEAAVLSQSDQQILVLYRVLRGDTSSLYPSTTSPPTTWPFMDVNYDEYSIPVFRAGTGLQSVLICDYDGNLGWPSPKWSIAEQGGPVSVPAPAGTVRPAGPTDTDADGHLVLYDSETFMAYDFWQATTVRDAQCQSQGGGLTGGTILEAGVVDFFDVRGSGTNPDTYYSARAVGTPLLAGLILPEDVESGVIAHALSLAIPGLRNTNLANPFEPFPSDYFYPASTTETDFFNSDPFAMAAGQRIRLKQTIVDEAGDVINETQLTPITRMFLMALRTYGACLVDNAGGFSFYAEDIHTAVLNLSEDELNTLIGQPTGTPLPQSKTKWQIAIEKLNEELEQIPIAYGPWQEGQNPATATITTSNFEVVEPATVPDDSPDIGYLVTSDLWVRAVINTEEKGPIEAVWEKGGEDTTSRGDRVIWGHFYASPNDVIWGSQNNPDLFVKIWFDVSGRIDVNYFHVSVPDIEVYSDYSYDGTPDEHGTTTMSRRYIRQYYENSQSYSEENYEDGVPPAGYSPAGNPSGYSTINDLRIGSMINTVEKGPIDAIWNLGGQDTTARGDQVVWGHFYASPSDVTWGSENNPDLYVKIWFDVSGRVDVNFFHVSVPDIEVYSDFPEDYDYDSQGTTIMDNRYIRHEFSWTAGNGNGQPLSLSQVKYWAYQIQDIGADGAVDNLANSRYDMLVIEPTRTDWSSSDNRDFDTKGMVDRLKNTKASDGIHRKLIIAYIDIGQAEDWRWYWKWSVDSEWDPSETSKPSDWPSWIITHDPEWVGCFPVAYWHEDWQNIVINGGFTWNDSAIQVPAGTENGGEGYNSILDEVIKDGFDGIYLDWVEAFSDEAVITAAEAAQIDPVDAMFDFIEAMRQYGRTRFQEMGRDPDEWIIIQQNAPDLAVSADTRKFTVIDGIAEEGVWWEGTGDAGWDDPTSYDVSAKEKLGADWYDDVLNVWLPAYKLAGIPVFACEYALENAEDVYTTLAPAAGFVPYCTRRSLSQLTTTPPYFE